MRFADFHTHSTFSDGSNTREGMVLAAIDKGLYAIGFSDHAPMPFEDGYANRQNWLVDSISEVKRLRLLYGDKIKILAGLELDVNTDIDPAGLDYILEGNHFINVGDKYVATDWGFELVQKGADDHFGGDLYKFFEHYYEELSHAGNRGPAIIAHFDVVSKQNEGNRYFDENDPRYLTAAITCIEELSKKNVLFEVNMGAVFRGYRTSPYPALPFLKRMKELGCRVILSGDSHCTDALCHKFDEALEYIALAGYTEFEKYPIDRK